MTPEGNVFVAIDRGNTRIKATALRCGPQSISVVGECTEEVPEGGIKEMGEGLERFGDFLRSLHIDDGAICTVCGDGEEIREALRQNTGNAYYVIDRTTELPMEISYATPSTLGFDRIAAAAGVGMLEDKTGSMVADAGTALTLDVLERGGDDSLIFRGGNISAGIRMRICALHNFTRLLPEVDSRGEVPTVGYDTATAIRSGAVMGAVYEIAGAYRQAKKENGVSRLYLTGGDAARIGMKLREIAPEIAREIKEEPTLVAVGIYNIYKYSRQKEKAKIYEDK
ncbi:MAG: type III pantothenate kinase [Muribaculum sp.]|nr:type III pantothenate kinase [Muribaculum sp.]